MWQPSGVHHRNLPAGSVIVWGHQLLHLKSIFTFFTRPYFSQFTLSPWLNVAEVVRVDCSWEADLFLFHLTFVPLFAFSCLMCVCVAPFRLLCGLMSNHFCILILVFDLELTTRTFIAYHILLLFQYTVIRWNYFYLTYLCCDNITAIFHFSPANLCMFFHAFYFTYI